MTLQVIRIFRELSDHVGQSLPKNKAFYYSDNDVSLSANWTPNTDIIETEDMVEIRIELAGVRRDQVVIFLKNGNLVVQGARFEEKPQEQVYYHQLELSYGPFSKIIPLPETIEHNDIQAVLNDGLLQIKISKKSKVIEIPIISEEKV